MVSLALGWDEATFTLQGEVGGLRDEEMHKYCHWGAEEPGKGRGDGGSTVMMVLGRHR